MPPGAAFHLSLEEHVANLRKAGIDWKPPPNDKEKVEEITAPTASSVSHDPVRRGPQNATKRSFNKFKEDGEPHLSEDSESEMMGRGNTSGSKMVATRSTQKADQNSQLRDGEEARLDKEAFKTIRLKKGEKADKDESLTSWNFVVRYAELYVGKTNFPKVRPYFDSRVMLDKQHWDLFYLYDPRDLEADPFIFVPLRQVEAYLRLINKKEGIALTIPQDNEHRFALKFGSLRTQQPRYLGSTWGPGSFNQLLGTIPLPNPEDEHSPDAYQNERDDFSNLLRSIKESWVLTKGKGKNKDKSKRMAEKRKLDHKEWGRMTKRVQRYLGLRQTTSAGVNLADLALDVNKPAPFDTEKEVVFVCFDVECFEFNHNIITEVGFAVLDTKDLRAVAPGEGAKDWFNQIKATHFRIMDYKHLRNKKYVTGCPDKFQFGNSKLVGMESIQKRCIEIFVPKDESGKPRNVVIVGHGVDGDVKLIYQVDVDIHDLPGLVEIVDSQHMHQHHQKLKDSQKLGTVLNDLGIEHCFLHNGGNDAVYTLQSMLALAVRRRQHSLAQQLKTMAEDPSIPKPPRKDADDGWSTGGEQSDGGPTPRLTDPNAEVKDAVGGVNWGLVDMQLAKMSEE